MADTSEGGIGTCYVFFSTSWSFGTYGLKTSFFFPWYSSFEEGVLLGTNLLSKWSQDEGY